MSGPVTEAVGNALGIGDVAQTVWAIAQVAGAGGHRHPDRRDPLLRHSEREAAEVPLDQHRRAPRDRRPGAGHRWRSGSTSANFSNYDKTYGSLAGIVIFLLWLWIANLALLFGAEFDAELERGRQLQAGIAAEKDIQLPPRDTRKSDKAAEKEQKDIAEGRRIRQQHEGEE